MKATPEQQAELLELQKSDLRTLRLSHLEKTHPLGKKLAELSGRAQDLQRYTVALSTQLSDQQSTADRLEGQLQLVRDRGKVQQDRLDSGKVGIRDMSAVEHEILKIKERESQLEGELLLQMEAIEKGEKDLADAKRQIVALEDDEAATKAELAQSLEEPTAEREQLEVKIAQLRDSLPSELVEEYDRLKERQGPVVILQLKDGVLVNSPVHLTADELDRAAATPADEIFVSDESGLFIVRTS